MNVNTETEDNGEEAIRIRIRISTYSELQSV